MNIKVRAETVRKKNESLKKSSNRFLRRFLFIFCVGYLFFLASPFWMPDDYSGIKPTKIGSIVSANDRDVMLLSWVYCKEQKEMEIQIEINNVAIDGIDRYKWSVVDINKGFLDVIPIIETDDLVVLKVANVPRRWTEISLRMELKNEDKAKNNDFNTVKLYTSKKKIDRVNKIEKLGSLSEYKKRAIQTKIDTYEDNIATLEQDIKNEKSLICEAEKTIENLERNKKYQTENEILDTNERIARVKTEIENSEDKISDIKLEIQEFEEKITKQEEKRKLIGG